MMLRPLALIALAGVGTPDADDLPKAATVLVYKIDKTKGADVKHMPLLIEALKKRIDPNGSFPIVIRPAGQDGRFEIVIPMDARAAKAEHVWRELLTALEKKYRIGKEFGSADLQIGRGKMLELARVVHMHRLKAVWMSDQVFGSKEGWLDLLKRTYDSEYRFPGLKNPQEDAALNPLAVADTIGKLNPAVISPLAGGNFDASIQLLHNTWRLFTLADFKTTKPGDLKKFVETLLHELREGTSERTIEAWIKEQAWEKMLDRARGRWPEIKTTLFDPNSRADQEARRWDALGFKIIITPDSHDEMVGFLQTKGNLFGAAGLAMLEPLLGQNILEPGDKKQFVSHKEADDFIQAHYGPSLRGLVADLEDEYRKHGGSPDLAVDDVQRIKELVSTVGTLEFRVLANEHDDAAALADAGHFFTDPRNWGRLKEARERGEPPPGPLTPGTGTPRVYQIKLARGATSKVTYSWVEVGPPQLRDLGLDNASENSREPRRYKIWQQAKSARHMQRPTQLGLDGKKLLNGALFYSRVCQNQNLREPERASKAYDYFVLVRDPELDPNDPKEMRGLPRLDARYMTQASAKDGAIHFTFDRTGAELFGHLTRKNLPDDKGGDGNKRHLAILLDGLIQSAPTINTEIRDKGQISGNFTREEVDRLVQILRSGALPMYVNPEPVSETIVGDVRKLIGDEDKNKGPPPRTEVPDAKADSSMGLIIGLGAGGLAMGVIVLLVILRNNKQRQ